MKGFFQCPDSFLFTLHQRPLTDRSEPAGLIARQVRLNPKERLRPQGAQGDEGTQHGGQRF